MDLGAIGALFIVHSIFHMRVEVDSEALASLSNNFWCSSKATWLSSAFSAVYRNATEYVWKKFLKLLDEYKGERAAVQRLSRMFDDDVFQPILYG